MKLKAILFAAALSGSGTALAGIADTKHNLGSTGPGNTVSDTDEICVFCHTPHGASQDVNAPLWNKAIAPVTYDSYSSTTLDGETASVGHVSLACLSCHDGTQAMDNIVNSPGSGGYDPTGGGTNGLGYTWTGSGIDTTTGKMLPASSAYIGPDLTNDHPIGIQYGGGGITENTPTAATNDTDFNAPESSTIDGLTSWWVDTSAGVAGIRNKTDMILYTRVDFQSGLQEPSVECASCHDPHTSDNATFLRISNSESGVCLACHTK